MGKTYPLAQAVANGAPIKMDWVLVDVMHYTGFGEYMDAERFKVLRMKGRDCCTYTKELICLAAHGAYIKRK